MKTLLGTADIHTDDDGTGLVLIYTNSSARKDSPYICCFQPTPAHDTVSFVSDQQGGWSSGYGFGISKSLQIF